MKLLLLTIVLIMMQGFSPNISIAGQAKAGWETDWEKTLAAARQEGQVNLYSTTPAIETGVFQKAYPGIKVVTGAGGPG